MHQEDTLRYYETEDFQAVDLLYGNGAFAMTVLLPTAGAPPAECWPGSIRRAGEQITERFHEAEVTPHPAPVPAGIRPPAQ